MSTGTLKTGYVEQTYAPSLSQHTIRLQDFNGWNTTQTLALSPGTPDGSVTIPDRLVSMRIEVAVAVHTGPYTSRLSILATDTNYRGAILIIVDPADANDTLELYDDAAYTNLIYTFPAFVAATQVQVLLFPYNGSFIIKA